MYEPLILEKKKRRSLSGTLFAKVNTIIIFTKIFAYCGSLFLLSNYMMKRKKFIAELNEAEITIGGFKIVNRQELEATEYWKVGFYEGVYAKVRETYYKAEKLAKNSFNATSTDTQNE